MRRRDILKSFVCAPFVGILGLVKPQKVEEAPKVKRQGWYAWQEVGYPQIDPIVYTSGVQIHITQRIDGTLDIYFVFHDTDNNPEESNRYENYMIDAIEWEGNTCDQYDILNTKLSPVPRFFKMCKITRLGNKVRLEDVDGNSIRITLGEKLNA